MTAHRRITTVHLTAPCTCGRALQERLHPGVIFSDIHLADGLSFSIWEREAGSA